MPLELETQTVQSALIALLLALRLLPMVALCPWLAGGFAPRAVQLALVLVLDVCLLATAASHAPTLPRDAFALAALGLRELGVGLVYGLALALPVQAIGWGGALIEHARGEGEAEAGPFARLYLALAAVAFVTLDGHLLALRGLAASLAAVPVGVLSAPADPAALALSSVKLVGQAFATALLVALPVLLALLAAELLLSLLARLGGLPFLPALGPVARPALALAVVWIGLMALLGSFHGLFLRGLDDARALLELLR